MEDVWASKTEYTLIYAGMPVLKWCVDYISKIIEKVCVFPTVPRIMETQDHGAN